jgi:photosystem II stability/assembly factor-like uncharacterized protein
MNMKKRFILLTAALLSFSAIAQESKVESEDNSQTFSSIFDLMKRRDLNLKTIEKLADDYFKINGTGKGTGYKQYQRWLHESRFHVDENLNFIKPENEAAEYQKFVQNSSASNSKLMAAPIGNWTEKGPYINNSTTGGHGRLSAMAIHPSDTNIIYVGSPGGGLWKSTNAGVNWLPLTDNNANWMSIFSIAIDPANQSVIYAGTGTTTGNSFVSDQVIKSTNGGASWTVLGVGPTGDIRKILIHPTNSSIVFAAATNGIWRSTNSGTSWTQVSPTSIEDIEFKPGNPNIMMASGTEILRSTNNGQTWTLHGAGQGVNFSGSRTLLAVSPNNPNVVYAVQADGENFGRILYSSNSGATFEERAKAEPNVNNFFGYSLTADGSDGQANYDMAICVSPTNANEVHIGGVNTWKSADGGKTFVITADWNFPNPIGYVHADIHGLEFVGSTLYVISDGGISKSTDNGNNFSFITAGLGIRQVYHIASSNTNYNVLTAGAQDNASVTRNASNTYVPWGAADGFEGLVSPTNPTNLWGTIQRGQVIRSTDAGQSFSYVGNFGGSFYTRIAGHPTNENIIYGAGVGVYKSTNGGVNFTKVSGNTIQDAIGEVAVAPSNGNYVYAHTATELFVSKNGGNTWTAYGYTNITDIAISPSDPNKLWVTFWTGGVYLLTNAGASFLDISGNLPQISSRAITVDYSTNENLYVALNQGVYTYSNNDNTWTEISANLPKVYVNELEIQKSSGLLRAATFGRGIWEYNYNVAACATAYEPNNSPANAALIFKNTNVFGAIPAVTDEDNYKFTLNQTATVTITLTGLPANYRLELLTNTGALIQSSNNASTANETIIRNLATGVYKVRILAANSSAFSPNCYTLKVESSILLSKSATGNSIGVESDNNNNLEKAAAGIMYPNPANDQLNVDVSSFNDVFSVLITNKEGFVQSRRDNIGDNKLINFNVSDLPPGIYFVQIFSVTKELKTLKLIKE